MILDPQHVHAFAGRRNRVALHLEGHDIARVVVDEGTNGALAITLREETEEVAAVQIVAVEGKAAPFGVDFTQRAKPAIDFRAHHAFEVAVAEAPVIAGSIGLVIDGEAFDDPGRLQDVGKEWQQPAEHVAQSQRGAARLV